jgi:hypothetical protein
MEVNSSRYFDAKEAEEKNLLTKYFLTYTTILAKEYGT